MKKKVIKLNEQDIENLVKKIIKEDGDVSATERIDQIRKNIGDDNVLRMYLLGVKTSRNTKYGYTKDGLG